MGNLCVFRILYFLTITILLSGCVVHPKHQHRHGAVKTTKAVIVAQPASIVVKIPSASPRISWKGHYYYMHQGLFYKRQRRGFVLVQPPVGFTLKRLPAQYAKIVRNGRQHFHYKNIYFRWSEKIDSYVVVTIE